MGNENLSRGVLEIRICLAFHFLACLSHKDARPVLSS